VSSWKIRHEAWKANRQLDLGPNPSLHAIQSWIEAKCGRPILIMEQATLRGDDLCGWCILYQGINVVVHAPVRSTWHLQQIVLHEFAHLILGHQFTATSLELMHLPGFPEPPLMTLGRSSYVDDAEATAEYLADLLTARIAHHTPDATGDPAGFNQVFG
jgi:hypothetical protein